MAESLSAKMQEQMRALCRKISVAHDLDPEIQEELYGHMEDKLHAYLTGDEPLTEEDAFILVREHFGDPAVLKGLLQDVHAHAVHVTLARRIAAAVIATMGLSVAVHLLRLPIGLLSVICAAKTGSAIGFLGAAQLCSVSLSAAAAILLCVILYRWHRKLGRNERPWFVRWRPIYIAAAIALLLVLKRLIPAVTPAHDVFAGQFAQPSKYIFALITVGLVLSRLVVPVVTALAWLWWCDRPPRTNFALLYGFLAWLIFNPLVASFSGRLPRMMLHISRSDIAGISETVVTQGRALGSSLLWRIGFERVIMDLPFGDVPFNYFYHLYYLIQPGVLVTGLGVMTLFMYALFRYIGRTHVLVQYVRGNHADLLHQA
jgi:hypothetical protein